MASVASISILPLFYSFVINSPYYSLDLFFPRVDQTTWSGFVITYLFLLIGSYFWTPTLVASDVLYFSQLILSAGHLKVMMALLEEVEEEIREAEPEAEGIITQLLKRVCFEHQQHLLLVAVPPEDKLPVQCYSNPVSLNSRPFLEIHGKV